MKVAVHQPQYLPWLGYFDKLQRADAFCYLDNVQYKKNEWQNRNRIKTRQGWQWLTVPVHYRFPQKIRDVRIDNTVNWKHKHLQALVTNYGRAPYFRPYIDIFKATYAREWHWLAELNIHLIEQIRIQLGLGDKHTLRASALQLSREPTERLIGICETLGADAYLSGPDGLKYMDADRFAARGLRLELQQFNHPIYPQLFGEFVPQLSVVDLLFNCGPDSREVITADASHPLRGRL